MENAVDALYMGFAILVFVIALSLSIFSFTEVTNASQRIIDARDKTTLYNYFEPEGTARKVTREDIIPTLYRIFNEEYTVEFIGIENLYKVKTPEGESEINFIENKAEYGINDSEIGKDFITKTLQGKAAFNDFIREKGITSYKEYLPNQGLYDILEGKTFKEEIGLYYSEDQQSNNTDDVNKTKKRIITYTLLNN